MNNMNFKESISDWTLSKLKYLQTTINNIQTTDSVEFLSWITAGVLAILGLVTIIFTIYNEGVVQRANNLIREIKIKTAKPTKENTDITIQNIGEVIFLLTNKDKYKKAMKFFIFILWLLGVIWALATIVYCVKHTNPVEVTLIISAYIIMIITFIGLPKLFNSFNKTILDYDNLNSIEYLEGLVELLQFHGNLDSSKVLCDYVNPTFKFKKQSDCIQLEINTLIPTSDYTILLILQTVNDERLTIKIRINNQVANLITYKKFLIKNSNPNFNYEGLFERLKNSNPNNPTSIIHILSNSKNMHNCFQLMKENTSNETVFKLQDKQIRSLTSIENGHISRQENFLKHTSNQPEVEFTIENM
ncbi:hypothetical protein [Bacillus toyonensis]|uniref:hypothetical protein n=1 Tax=Bacillus toyonensis TaxID=155322 RepID=UPI000BF51E09|nr:hypothetical protein [Bacillus toyonensis]PGC72706.1 hypothetical protein COM28_27040 [Bacillus toyonensis]